MPVADRDFVRISAIVCTYGHPQLLEEAVRSLQAQSFAGREGYEIIVVDNKPADGTATMIHDMASEGPVPLRYLQEAREGLSQARNTGIREAKGEIVAFLDDDAKADPNWLASLLEVYDSNPNVWAVGGKVLPIWDAPRPSWLADTMLRSLSIVDWGDELRTLRWPERLIGTNCSFARQAFSQVGLFSTELGRKGNLLMGHEDTELQRRILSSGKLVVYTPAAVVHHHVPAERMTRRYFCRRARGTGRSEAVLTATRHGRTGLAVASLRMGLVSFPEQVLALMLATIRRKDHVSTLQALAHIYGFLSQAIRLPRVLPSGRVANEASNDAA